ncbi:MAG: DUF4199 domain-containing protein [Bacteroidota bacterium]
MQNQGVKFGLIYGGFTIIVLLVGYWTAPESMMDVTSWRSIVSYLVMGVCMFLAAKKTRDAKGGFIPFGEAFVPPMVTYVIGGLIGILATYLLVNVIDPSLQEVIIEGMIEMQEGIFDSVGMPEDQKIQALEELEEQMTENGAYGLAQISIGFLTNVFFIGLPISAIIAAIVKKKEPEV